MGFWGEPSEGEGGNYFIFPEPLVTMHGFSALTLSVDQMKASLAAPAQVCLNYGWEERYQPPTPA